jgi:hypothetical protein
MSFEYASNLNKSVSPLAFNSRMAGQNGAQKLSTKYGLDTDSLVILGPDFRREDELLVL